MTRTRWAVLVAIVLGGMWYAALPPSPAGVGTAAGERVPVRGVIHVHTRRSDGSGTLDQVAAAAARAGLQFVITTDHGDATRRPEAPSVRAGVLCIDAVEITTDNGHLVALGLPQAPYPLGGEARDVVEDVRRLGGLSFAAHPGSARPALRWTDWNPRVDGIEWLNIDSEWRDEGWVDLLRSLVTYPAGGAAALTALLDRPADVLSRWDAMTGQRAVVALAGTDAHSTRLPSYEQMFRTLSVALPGVQLTGDARVDAPAVIEAIGRGHTYSTIDGLATPGVLMFGARSGTSEAVGGDRLAIAGPVDLAVQVNTPPGGRIVLLRDGQEAASSDGPALAFGGPPEPAVYRVEVHLPGAPGSPPVPWIVSNPIYVGPAPAPAASAPPAPAAAGATVVYSDGPATGWTIEKNEASEGQLDVVSAVGGSQLSLRYGLGGARSDSPYAAAIVPLPGTAAMRAIRFQGRAARPARLSVQLRAADGRRWRRSVYLEETVRSVRIPLDEMTAVPPATGRPEPGDVRDLMFVVDTVNTAPGTNGQFWLDDVAIEP